MAQDDRRTIHVDKKEETRTKEISKMIDEGGLGSRTHYNIIKNATSAKPAEDLQCAPIVNQLVANLGILYVKLHQYHWYVKGSQFYTLHEKFEELYGDVTGYFDAFAERLIAIGGKPYSTLAEFTEHGSIEETIAGRDLSSDDMVGNIIADFETMKQITNAGIQAAANDHDAVTEDMLIAYVEYIDLTNWMLRAFLGK